MQDKRAFRLSRDARFSLAGCSRFVRRDLAFRLGVSMGWRRLEEFCQQMHPRDSTNGRFYCKSQQTE